MVSLKDIARATGISVTQVSRALNGYSDVSEETKNRVIKVSSEMGYVKNINAQRLATSKSNQIAAIVLGFSKEEDYDYNLLFPELKGINAFALSVGYDQVIYLVDSGVSYLQFCKQRGISGAVVFGAEYEDENFKQLINSDFPCVVMDIPVDGINKGSVFVNNSYYVMNAVDLLIKKGRKKIAFMCGKRTAMVSVERIMGYQMGLSMAGIEYNPDLIGYGEFNSKISEKETIRLMHDNSDIDAFVCASDFMAIGCVRALTSMGKKIPQDISIFGFDGIPLIDLMDFKISTIKQDNYKKGYSAAELLYKIVNGEASGNRGVVIPCTIQLDTPI